MTETEVQPATTVITLREVDLATWRAFKLEATRLGRERAMGALLSEAIGEWLEAHEEERDGGQ